MRFVVNIIIDYAMVYGIVHEPVMKIKTGNINAEVPVQLFTKISPTKISCYTVYYTHTYIPYFLE